MGRVLMAWEQGGNLGHLARLVPVASALRSCGHEVRFAIKNPALGPVWLRPCGFRYEAAPSIDASTTLHRPTSFADVLLGCGFRDRSALQVAVNAWLSLYDAFSPDVIVADYSPTALLACKASRTRCVQLGHGFDLPPNADPLPAFPASIENTPHGAQQADAIATAEINAVLERFGVNAVPSCAGLFHGENDQQIFTTFAELDHYGERIASYVGPIYARRIFAKAFDDDLRIGVFAYLDADAPGLDALLDAFAALGCPAYVAIPNALHELQSRSAAGLTVSSNLIDIAHACAAADVVVTHGGMGTVSAALLAGKPLVLLPRTVEQSMLAQRIKRCGAASVARGPRSGRGYEELLRAALDDEALQANAQRFSRLYASFTVEHAVQEAASIIERAM